MKKLLSVLFVFLILCLPVFMVGCKDDGDNENQINIPYNELNLLTKTNAPNSWANISATRIDEDGEEKITINKVETEISPVSIINTQNNKSKWNFVVENNNEKIYCKDNVRYHKGKNRNYVDESDFDGQKFVDNVIDEYLDELYDFFEEDDEHKLISSNKTQNGDVVTFEFLAVLDEEDNEKLKVTIILRKELVVLIKFEIMSDDKSDEVYVEIKEGAEVVATPEWFDNDDFKTTLTYEQAKEIASNENLFNNWQYAELNLPVGYSDCQELEKVYTSKTEGVTYRETSSSKKYYNGTTLFTYENNVALNSQELSVEDKKNYTFDDIINEYKYFTYYYFFDYEYEYLEYFQAAKKYEKEIDVVSYKFAGISGLAKFEAICSLYFDLSGNLYQISCYIQQYNISDPINPVLSFEINDLTIKKAQSIQNPIWFDESDFE